MQGKTETEQRCGRRGNVATMRLVTGDWREVDRAKRASRRRLAGGGEEEVSSMDGSGKVGEEGWCMEGNK